MRRHEVDTTRRPHRHLLEDIAEIFHAFHHPTNLLLLHQSARSRQHNVGLNQHAASARFTSPDDWNPKQEGVCRNRLAYSGKGGKHDLIRPVSQKKIDAYRNAADCFL